MPRMYAEQHNPISWLYAAFFAVHYCSRYKPVVVAAGWVLPRFAISAGSGMDVIQGADCNRLGIPIGTSRIIAIYEKGKYNT